LAERNDIDVLDVHGFTVLQAGDHAYVFCRPGDRPYVELLFGRPEDT
jgi:Trk K+ transport system NAD-binding subunit